MPKAKVGEVNLYYEVHGEGEPLLLIQGGTATTTLWGPVIPLLSREYRVVAFDNRGMGYSDAPDSPCSTKMMADDTAGLLDALGIDSAHVFGVSLGGMIAQEVALNHPRKVISLILGCTNYGGSHAPVPDVLVAAVDQVGDIPKEDVAKMMPGFLFTPEFIASNPKAAEEVTAWTLEKPLPPHVCVHHAKAGFAHDTYERVPQIKAPTLVIGGEKDILMLPQYQRDLASRIPNAELFMWEDKAHGFLLQKPEETIKVILDFLSRHPKK